MGENVDTLYLCDPSRNRACAKDECYVVHGQCCCTRHPEFALADSEGKLVVADERLVAKLIHRD